MLVWLDVVSLSGKEITTTLTKKSSKKLSLGTCQKTAFSFNGKMYKQTYDVSMGDRMWEGHC